MLTTIYLHGRLGRKFGAEYKLDVFSPAEAIRALCIMLPGFEQYLRESHLRNVAYRVFTGRKTVSPAELLAKLSKSEVHLFPVPYVAGSKKGWGQIIVGVVLIIATVVSQGATGSLWGNYLAALQAGGATGFATMLGTAMVFGGISQLLANPVTAKFDQGDSSRSYIFNGSAHTSRQGGPVPVGYGKLHVGAQVISMGVVASNDRPGTLGGDGTEPSDNEDGSGAYGAADAAVELGRAAGTADWYGSIDTLGRPTIPTEPILNLPKI